VLFKVQQEQYCFAYQEDKRTGDELRWFCDLNPDTEVEAFGDYLVVNDPQSHMRHSWAMPSTEADEFIRCVTEVQPSRLQGTELGQNCPPETEGNNVDQQRRDQNGQVETDQQRKEPEVPAATTELGAIEASEDGETIVDLNQIWFSVPDSERRVGQRIHDYYCSDFWLVFFALETGQFCFAFQDNTTEDDLTWFCDLNRDTEVVAIGDFLMVRDDEA
jgi:hypothetical protein